MTVFKERECFEKTTFGNNVEVFSHIKLHLDSDNENDLYCLKSFKEPFEKRYIFGVEYSELKKFFGCVRLMLNSNFNSLNGLCVNMYNEIYNRENGVYLKLNKEKRELIAVSIVNGIESVYRIFHLRNKHLESKVFNSCFLSLKTLNNLAKAMEILTTRLRKGFYFEFTKIRLSENKLAFSVEYYSKRNNDIKSLAYVMVNFDKVNIENELEKTKINGSFFYVDRIENSFNNENNIIKECILDMYYFKNFTLKPTADINNTIYDIEIKQGIFKIETKGKEIFSCPVESDLDFNFQLNWIQLFSLLNDFSNLENKYRKLFINDNYLKIDSVSKADDLRYTSAFVL